jgi:MraZ protein, putative antitoxin-like
MYELRGWDNLDTIKGRAKPRDGGEPALCRDHHIDVRHCSIQLSDQHAASKVTIDQAGRLVLPKKLRNELRLTLDHTLTLSVQGDAVTLRPRRHSSPMHNKDGIWVLPPASP